MSDFSSKPTLKLDPWAASSLLQKAIRRGEVELAQYAAELFRRYRGNAVWRRLMLIAAEDIGIADISLLQEVVRLGSDKALSSMLGSDAELISHLCARMAAATKDRSCDYLYCSGTKLPTAKLESCRLGTAPFEQLVKIVADESVPLVKRAVAALTACRAEKCSSRATAQRAEALLSVLSVRAPHLDEAVLRLIAAGMHEFAIMLPLIWCRWWHSNAGSTIMEDELPAPEFVGGVPLYVFDKHTAAGKQAIADFLWRNDELQGVLKGRVPQGRWPDVTAMAAFYADATPLARRLHWPAGSLLARSGFLADMADVGCDDECADVVLCIVEANLPDLNRCRKVALTRCGRPEEQPNSRS